MKRYIHSVLLVVIVAVVSVLFGGEAQAANTEYRMSTSTRVSVAKNERQVKQTKNGLYVRCKKREWKQIIDSKESRHITCFATDGKRVYYGVVREGRFGCSDIYTASLKTRKQRKVTRISGWIEAIYRYNDVLVFGMSDDTEYDRHSIHSYNLETGKEQMIQDHANMLDARNGYVISWGNTQDGNKPVTLYSIPLYTIPIDTNEVQMICASAAYPIDQSLQIRGDTIYYAVCIKAKNMKNGVYQIRSAELDGKSGKSITRPFRAYQIQKVTNKYVRYNKKLDGKTHKMEYIERE